MDDINSVFAIRAEKYKEWCINNEPLNPDEDNMEEVKEPQVSNDTEPTPYEKRTQDGVKMRLPDIVVGVTEPDMIKRYFEYLEEGRFEVKNTSPGKCKLCGMVALHEESYCPLISNFIKSHKLRYNAGDYPAKKACANYFRMLEVSNRLPLDMETVIDQDLVRAEMSEYSKSKSKANTRSS